MKFLIVLTFCLGHAGLDGRGRLFHDCPNWPCVEDVLSHSTESTNLERLRVFEKEKYKTLGADVTAEPPIVDWVFH